ncbi:hypothetical protein ABZ484_16295 [Streptomyces sp. NPDC006393]|uniref:hypothetical protein n=1 Tax=Streptomyces sp. NPDC006393 TaxID=3156763 RepID=UPI0033D65643
MKWTKYLAGAAVTVAVAGVATVSYAAPAKAPHETVRKVAAAKIEAAPAGKARAAKTMRPATKSTASTLRVVAPGERVTAAPGFRLWLTAEGKHWTTPTSPEPQFRSVVDGNIDRNTPGVSLQSEITDGRAYLSGLYYGGKGVASGVEIETTAGTVHGKLIELAGHPGWGVWYATAQVGSGGGSRDFVSQVTVHDTEGGIYAQLKTQ